ncbi:MAG TPA: carboxypeptidase regulatory-like domain-containing protein [Longimicrobiales bacterium]|nr:carboxypeptidase regulatory-like domain-containing protein [Longimicrobiales bacterium]
MKAALVAVLLAAVPDTAAAQSLLHGKVVSIDSVEIAAAHVTLHDSAGSLKAEMLTDSTGGFRFRVASATKTMTLFISVTRIGFVAIERIAVRVGRTEDVTVRAFMSPDAVEIEPLKVVARRQYWPTVLDDYHGRLADIKRGVGYALEREVLQRYAGLDLLRALRRVPGVQLGDIALRGGMTLPVPRMRDGCIPLTYIDRMLVSADQLAALDPALLEGVLVYVGVAQIPVDVGLLAPATSCGVILAYTAPPVQRRTPLRLLNVGVVVVVFLAVLFFPGL